LSGPIDGPARLTVWGQAIAAEPSGQQRISVFVNERAVAIWSIQEFVIKELHAEIPRDVDLTGPIRIRFTVDKPVRPIDRHMNHDTRPLGLWLNAFQIGQAQSSE
jgi:hypothetical protein